MITLDVGSLYAIVQSHTYPWAQLYRVDRWASDTLVYATTIHVIRRGQPFVYIGTCLGRHEHDFIDMARSVLIIFFEGRLLLLNDTAMKISPALVKLC